MKFQKRITEIPVI